MGLFTNDTWEYHHNPNINMSINRWEIIRKKGSRLNLFKSYSDFEKFRKTTATPLWKSRRPLASH